MISCKGSTYGRNSLFSFRFIGAKGNIIQATHGMNIRSVLRLVSWHLQSPIPPSAQDFLLGLISKGSTLSPSGTACWGPSIQTYVTVGIPHQLHFLDPCCFISGSNKGNSKTNRKILSMFWFPFCFCDQIFRQQVI